MRQRITVKWEPRDLWIGVYWTREHTRISRRRRFRVYVCVVPCLPIVWTGKWADDPALEDQ